MIGYIFPADIGSAVSTLECDKLAELAAGKTCLEIGGFLGRSSVVIGQVAHEFHSVDWHRGESIKEKDTHLVDSLPAWVENMRRFDLLDKTVLHMGTSDLVLPSLRPGWFEFAFVDGDHRYENVRRELAYLSIILRPESKVMLHDYTWEELGVQQAVDELFSDVELCGTSAIVEV